MNSQWDPAQRMIEKGMQNYYQKTFELAVDFIHGSTATGKHHNVSPGMTVLTRTGVSTAVTTDGASGGGGNGNTEETSDADASELIDTMNTVLAGVLAGPLGSAAYAAVDKLVDGKNYLADKATDFIDKSWDSPIGIAAGIAVCAVTVAALIATAPVTIPAVCGALAAGAVAGTVTNLLVGAGDVIWRENGHQSLSDHVSPELHNQLRLGRDIYQWAGVLGEAGILSGKLALGLARGGTKLKIGGFNNWWKRGGGGESANLALRKYNWFWERPASIPANWKVSLARKGNGIIVRDAKKSYNIFRWMDPGRSGDYYYPRGYYRIQDKAGIHIDYMGNRTTDKAAAHIDGGIKLRKIPMPWPMT